MNLNSSTKVMFEAQKFQKNIHVAFHISTEFWIVCSVQEEHEIHSRGSLKLHLGCIFRLFHLGWSKTHMRGKIGRGLLKEGE